jgi:regulator of ribonuclease activity A
MKSYTADICDNHISEVQVLNPLFKSFGGVSMCHGEVTTIKLDEDNSSLVEMLKNENGNGDIAVVDVGGAHCAVVGDNLMGFARDNNWAGIVVNGYVRDTYITKNIPVGLWALGTYPLKSSKKAASKRDIELNFSGVTFRPGEYLYADHDGIIVMHRNVVDIASHNKK